MLVLSRRVGESLVIGDEITITVLEFRGDVIRIGVDARHIQVRRQELLVELAETNRAAASPATAAVAGLSRLVSGAGAEPDGTAPDTPEAGPRRDQPPSQPPTQPPAQRPPQRPGPGTGPRPGPTG